MARLERVGQAARAVAAAIGLSAGQRAGDVVARLEGAVVERGGFRLGPVDLDIGWRERIALTGRNGSGKSTLIAALLGKLPLVAGQPP